MSLLQKSIKNNDIICINDKAYNAFLYYAGSFGLGEKITRYIKFTDRVYSDNGIPFVFYRYEYPVFNDNGYFIGLKEKSDLNKLYLNSKDFLKDGNRTWLIFSNFNESKSFIIKYFNTFGAPKKEISNKNTSFYLYDKVK